jgi:S-adenosylmethionine hydrolase
MPPTIALLTDFGTQDPYVGIMKGVIASAAPQARVIDISHGVPPQDVLVGALWLDSALDWFPADTIFLVVVDPGVGSERRVVACEIGTQRFVGPDNGLLSAVLQRRALGRAVATTEARFHREGGSDTFHGRDIMAPVAAWLALGTPLDSLGPPVDSLQRLVIPEARRVEGMTVGEVLYSDHYGNLITSITADQLEPGQRVRIGSHSVPLLRTYAEVEPGGLLALVGSTKRLEISQRDGSAAATLGVGQGEAVIAVEEPA